MYITYHSPYIKYYNFFFFQSVKIIFVKRFIYIPVIPFARGSDNIFSVLIYSNIILLLFISSCINLYLVFMCLHEPFWICILNYCYTSFVIYHNFNFYIFILNIDGLFICVWNVRNNVHNSVSSFIIFIF